MRPLRCLVLLCCLAAASPAPLVAAPEAELWPRWQTHDPASTILVDHGAWTAFLERYLVTDTPDGIHRVAYGDVTPADRQALQAYLERLQAVPVSRLARDEQMAFWINLYNALTVEVVLRHYPVESITDIDISPGWFSFGPWDAALVEVEGEALTLNDIEHRILRPIWQDPRTHYALNCASLGCPNLQPRAYTAEGLEAMLDRGARTYINHPRGARFEDDELIVSSIYDWFQADFGGDWDGVLTHLRRYAESRLAAGLAAYDDEPDDAYDWALNDASR